MAKKNSYSEIHLHVTWHTKGSLPLLNATVEPLAHRALRHRILEWPGVVLHEIGGVETHIHIAVTIPPTVLVSNFIGRIKGASSHDVNHQLGRRAALLQWQAGFGVLSFGTRQLAWVRRYIRDQREHHAKGTIVDRLERINDFDSPEAAVPGAPLKRG